MNPELMTQQAVLTAEQVTAQFDQITAGIGDLAVANPMMDYVRAMQGIDMNAPDLMQTAASAVSEANLSVTNFDEAYSYSQNLAAFAAGEQSRFASLAEDDEDELANA